MTSGDRVPASIVLEAPAGNGVDQETGVPSTRDVSFSSLFFPHAGGIVFPNGATSVPFAVPTGGKIAVKVVNHYGDEVLKVYTVG